MATKGSTRIQYNVRLAAIRLHHLAKHLAQNLVFRVRYDTVIHDMLVVGIMEEVSIDDSKGFGPVFYMPHRPVFCEAAASSKVRTVLYASAKGYNEVSLNECMEVGHSLLSNLTEILLRFRHWKAAIIDDVVKAFLQISEDRGVHKFLWNLDGQVRQMRFRWALFSNCSRPALLKARVKHHLETWWVSLLLCDVGKVFIWGVVVPWAAVGW